MSFTLEICANSVQSALAAQAGGAHRIELCQSLEQGGITPSYGLIRQVRALLQIPVFVLIRPRPGDFVYDAHELAIMQADIVACRELGCDGVVLGALTPAGRIDVPRCRELVALAHSLPVTFHRAFDDCADLAQALEDVIATGCQRLLTSGGQASAEAGQAALAALVQQAAGRLHIMPGAGISPANLTALAAHTGVQEFHASARQQLPPSPHTRLAEFAAVRWETDAATVAALRRVGDDL
ncbi:copper homeostasis protein CutC [Hymenobacter sp. ASUV-10]|uniref:PF03932 family protein CutC n=1 Tax=Hymenobacter aranciens TaxID=3063996 RepID=A0ABT9B7L2_9BACT|nr:copper homeostasis protein CutC [Hymenobacter sp. ASUV-10]MDO7874267.1 copper homeostasis protein CutC [Hymenobacter sp. ASUV-10]